MVVDLAQALGVDVAVHLGRRERRVAQQLLDRPQVGAALEQVRRERVAQAVRVRDEPAQRRGVQAAAVRREEQRVVRAAGELGPRVAEIPRDEERGLLAERDRRDPSRPCPGGRGRAPARSRRRRGRARPPRRCATRPSRPARRARGSEAAAGRRRRAPSSTSPISRSFGASGRCRVRARPERRVRARAPAPSVKRSSARTAASLREIVAGASRPPGRPRPSSATQSARTRTSTRSMSPVAVPIARTRAGRTRTHAASPAEIGAFERKRALAASILTTRSSRRGYHRLPVADRWQRLGELAVAGANVQRGQVLLSAPSTARRKPARAVASRGLQARREVRRRRLLRSVSEARPHRSTPTPTRSSFVPGLARRGAARARRRPRSSHLVRRRRPCRTCSPTSIPNASGKDQLPRLKEASTDRRRPHDELVHRPVPASRPGRSSSTRSSPRTRRTSGSGRTSSTSLRLDEPDPQRRLGRAHGRPERERGQAHRAALRRDPPGRARHRPHRRPLRDRAPGGLPTSARSTA